MIRVAADAARGLPGADVLRDGGDGSPRCYESHGASLFLFGHCLLSAQQVAAEFAATMESADLDRLAQWPGAYTAVLIRQGAVTAYTDLAGQFPLYYSQRQCELLVGPDAAELAAAHGRTVDVLSVAAWIACPNVVPLWWGRSAYAGVGRLEGGMVLRARPGYLEVDSSGIPRPVPGTSLADGAAGVREAVVGGVHARCADQRVSTDFSGGLDSSAVAFLAADVSVRPVPAVVYHQPLAAAADLTEALALARLTARIDLSVVRGSAQTLPFAGVVPGAAVGWPPMPEPSPRILTQRRDEARLTAVAQSGARLHLTGEGGDAVLLAPPAYLAELARRREFLTLWRHCGAYAQLRHVSPAVLAASAVRLARTSPAAALRSVAAELAAPEAAGTVGWAGLISWWPSSGGAAWLTARLRGQLSALAADPGTARTVPDGAGPADLATLADLRRSADAQRYLAALGRCHGLAVHAPYLDSAVVRAALSVTPVLRADPWSYKPLLRSALAGLVPAEVFGRATKGDYSAEDYRGARASITGLRELLGDSRLADLGVIEPGPVRAMLDRMAAGIAVPVGPLNMLLATELWLRSADDARNGVRLA